MRLRFYRFRRRLAMRVADSSGFRFARQTTLPLSRRFRSAHALAVEPGAVEAANAALPGGEHRAGIFDPAGARLLPLGGGDPVDPIPARIGCDVRP